MMSQLCQDRHKENGRKWCVHMLFIGSEHWFLYSSYCRYLQILRHHKSLSLIYVILLLPFFKDVSIAPPKGYSEALSESQASIWLLVAVILHQSGSQWLGFCTKAQFLECLQILYQGLTNTYIRINIHKVACHESFEVRIMFLLKGLIQGGVVQNKDIVPMRMSLYQQLNTGCMV